MPHTDVTDWSDEQLFDRIQRGEHDLFGALVRRFEHELYGYLRRYLGNDALAEDVFQNTFLQVYLKRDQFEPGRVVRPWLYTVATHQAIDALRRAARENAVSLHHAPASDGTQRETLGDQIPGHESSPPERLEQLELRELVRASVDQLPQLLRECLILAFYQGLKHKEIALVLDIPIGTVKSRLHAAFVRMQQLCAAFPPVSEP